MLPHRSPIAIVSFVTIVASLVLAILPVVRAEDALARALHELRADRAESAPLPHESLPSPMLEMHATALEAALAGRTRDVRRVNAETELAEIYRQLGRYDDALVLFADAADEPSLPTHRRIQAHLGAVEACLGLGARADRVALHYAEVETLILEQVSSAEVGPFYARRLEELPTRRADALARAVEVQTDPLDWASAQVLAADAYAEVGRFDAERHDDSLREAALRWKLAGDLYRRHGRVDEVRALSRTIHSELAEPFFRLTDRGALPFVAEALLFAVVVDDEQYPDKLPMVQRILDEFQVDDGWPVSFLCSLAKSEFARGDTNLALGLFEEIEAFILDREDDPLLWPDYRHAVIFGARCRFILGDENAWAEVAPLFEGYAFDDEERIAIEETFGPEGLERPARVISAPPSQAPRESRVATARTLPKGVSSVKSTSTAGNAAPTKERAVPWLLVGAMTAFVGLACVVASRRVKKMSG